MHKLELESESSAGTRPRRWGYCLAAIAIVVGAGSAFLAAPGSAAPPVPVVRDQWLSLGGVISGGPDVAGLSEARNYFFAPGTDHSVWMNDGTGWTSIGGQVIGGVGAGNLFFGGGGQDGRIDVVVRGLDNAVWHRWWDPDVSADWSAWESLGGVGASDPQIMVFDAAAGSGDDVDLVALVRGTDGSLWENRFAGGPEAAWGGWQNVGGLLIGGPGSGNNADDGTTAVRGLDNSIWYATFSHADGTWSDFTSAGGLFNEDPASELLCTATLFGRGLDNSIWTESTDPDSGFASIGGIAKSGPGTTQVLDNNPVDSITAVRGADDALWYNRHTWSPC